MDDAIKLYNELLEKYRNAQRALIEEFAFDEAGALKRLDAEIEEKRKAFKTAIIHNTRSVKGVIK